MCGRYLLDALPEALAQQFRAHKAPVFEARYNIAPTQTILAQRLVDGEPDWSMPRWGLIPAWSKDTSGGARMINARSETVAEKPAFRSAFKQRRCLIPASGFYEWQARPEGKQPILIGLQSSAVFGFAGLYEFWRDPVSHALIESATILTTAANESLKPVHERMPVIIAPEDYLTWLSATPAQASTLLRAWPAGDMRMHAVSKRVNNAREQGADLAAPIEP